MNEKYKQYNKNIFIQYNKHDDIIDQLCVPMGDASVKSNYVPTQNPGSPQERDKIFNEAMNEFDAAF